MDKYAELVVDNGATPMTIADAVVRECHDREVIEDVIFYLETYLHREYGRTETISSNTMAEDMLDGIRTRIELYDRGVRKAKDKGDSEMELKYSYCSREFKSFLDFYTKKEP